MFEEIRHFFKVYKELKGKETVANEFSGAEEAKKVISNAIDSYIENYCK